MTALRATTPNPDCEVCGGTGTDPVFYGDCTECWPDARLQRHREEFFHARRQAAVLPPPPPAPACCECGKPAMRYPGGDYAQRCDLHYWVHQAQRWEAHPPTQAAITWAAAARRRVARLQPQRTTSRQRSH